MTNAIVSGAWLAPSFAGNPERADNLLQADELQRDIRHRREDAGQRDREFEPPVAVTPEDEIAGGDVAVLRETAHSLGRVR